MADLEGTVNQRTEELDNTKTNIVDLHTNCDFLLENYDFWKVARATERNAGMNEMAAMQGAEVEVAQTSPGKKKCAVRPDGSFHHGHESSPGNEKKEEEEEEVVEN